jgi:hypothetical protein
MKNTIVLSRFNEDINWISLINNNKYNIIIYNKGEKIDNKDIIEIENIGREAHTYLHYIINNYDNLSNYTIFLQGEPFEHLTNKIRLEKSIFNGGRKNYDFYINLLGEENFLLDYLNNQDLSDIPLTDAKHIENIDGTNVSYNLDINKNINLLFFNPPNNFEFNCGAQFCISKKLIQKRPLSFYKFCYDKCYEDTNWPWIMERFWNLIFFTDTTIKIN